MCVSKATQESLFCHVHSVFTEESSLLCFVQIVAMNVLRGCINSLCVRTAEERSVATNLLFCFVAMDVSSDFD